MAGKTVDLDQVRHFVGVLKYVREERDRLDELEAEARDVIQDALGDKEIGVLDSKQVISWSRSSRRAVSVALVRELHPDVAEECTEEKEIRSFRVLPDEPDDSAR